MESAEDPYGAAMEGAGEATDAPREGAGERESAGAGRDPYVVPRYRAEGDPAWYHVLHGTVPGHQIDFMYCPDVPQGRLAQNHFGHLSRLMKYIEPRQGAPFAFALGNLSRDDVQHEPGHGGLALIFALRVAGVTDHAGRAMPPYAHGVLAIDRVLDYATLLQAITVFYRRFLDSGAQAEDATGSFYRAYVRVMREQRETVERFLHDYIRDFDDLPQPPRSTLRFDWEADEDALPKRVTIVHADDEPFENIAHAAALLGAMLYKSNIKWTAITSGRGIEIPGGVSIHIVPASEAPRDGKGLVVPIGELPDRESEVAVLFGAIALHVETKVTRAGWREAMAASKAEDVSASGTVGTSPRTTSPNLAHSSNRPPPVPSAPPPAPDAEVSVDFDEAATIPAPLERDPAFDPRRSSPMKGVPSAFDPRRSSPTKGVPSAFDPRRSSPVTGIVAASAGAAAVPAGKLSSVPPPPPSGNVDGPAAREPDARASQRAAAELERMNDLPAPKSRLGMWIGIAGGLGVIAAIAAALAGGTGDASSGSGATGAPSSSGSSIAAPPSASSTTVTATNASSSPEAPPGPSGAASTPEPGASAAPVSSGSASAKDAPTSAPAVTSTGAKTRPPATSTKTKRPSLRIP